MTDFATVSFISVENADGLVLFRWQGYQPGAVIDGHEFYPFNLGAIVDASNGGSDSVQVQLPMTLEAYALLDIGVTERLVVDISMYMFTPNTDGTMPAAKTLVAGYHGEIVGGNMDTSSVVLEIGSRLDAVEAQVPTRVFTTVLVGTPPKL